MNSVVNFLFVFSPEYVRRKLLFVVLCACVCDLDFLCVCECVVVFFVRLL